MNGKSFVEVKHSAQNERILQVLKDSGFVQNVKVFKESGASNKSIRVDFVMEGTKAKLTELKRVSKPGSRIYRESAKLRRVAGGFGVGVISTSRGVMSVDEARKKKLGGEVICIAY